MPSEEPVAGQHVRCPRCGSRTAWANNPHRPFCGLTCRLIDLGKWLDERYRVAGDPLPDDLPPDDRPHRMSE
ncbi:MAG: DNA gyrase inhibitor YacG [Isosphaeraceae bacterium]